MLEGRFAADALDGAEIEMSQMRHLRQSVERFSMGQLTVDEAEVAEAWQLQQQLRPAQRQRDRVDAEGVERRQLRLAEQLLLVR